MADRDGLSTESEGGHNGGYNAGIVTCERSTPRRAPSISGPAEALDDIYKHDVDLPVKGSLQRRTKWDQNGLRHPLLDQFKSSFAHSRNTFVSIHPSTNAC